MLDGVGHALFVDDAERFNSLLEDFLKNPLKAPEAPPARNSSRRCARGDSLEYNRFRRRLSN